MTGSKDESQWTLETLYEHLKLMIGQQDVRNSESLESLRQVTVQAQASAERAVNKAEAAAEKRFEAVNEFRSTLSDQQRNLMPRNEAEVMFKAASQRVDSLDSRIDALQLIVTQKAAEKAGMGQMWAMVLAGIGLIATLLAISGKLSP